MKRRLVFKVLTAASLCCAAGARAQMPADDTIPVPAFQLEKKPLEKLYHVSLNYSMGYNISATFKHLGQFPTPRSDPGPATGGTDHTYNNGYNRVDVTGNNHGGFQGTWYWGYRDASQISGDSLVMQSSSLASDVDSKSTTRNPQQGMELTFGRELGGARHWRWGLDGTFGFTDVTFEDQRTLTGNVNVVTDTYALNGIVPPLAPYAQPSPAGPGAIISDTPSRVTGTLVNGATISGSRELDAQLFGFKLGPYLDIPLNDYWALNLRGGLALVEVNSEFTYHETTVVPGAGSFRNSGQGWHNELLVGGYAAANLSHALNDSTRIFAGVQFQDVGQYTQTLNGRKAVLDLGKSIFVAIGLSYSY